MSRTLAASFFSRDPTDMADAVAQPTATSCADEQPNATSCAEAISQLELSTLGAEERQKVQDVLRGKGSETTNVRQKMQDFSAFALYLPESTWTLVMQTEVDHMRIVQAVFKWLADHFTLRCPSEPTYASLTAFLLLRESDDKRQQLQN